MRITKGSLMAWSRRRQTRTDWATGEISSRDVRSDVPQWHRESPLSAHLDYRTEIVKLWQERMNAGLDLTKHPECGTGRTSSAPSTGLPRRQRRQHHRGGLLLQLGLFPPGSGSYTRYFGYPDALKAR